MGVCPHVNPSPWELEDDWDDGDEERHAGNSTAIYRTTGLASEFCHVRVYFLLFQAEVLPWLLDRSKPPLLGLGFACPTASLMRHSRYTTSGQVLNNTYPGRFGQSLSAPKTDEMFATI